MRPGRSSFSSSILVFALLGLTVPASAEQAPAPPPTPNVEAGEEAGPPDSTEVPGRAEGKPAVRAGVLTQPSHRLVAWVPVRDFSPAAIREARRPGGEIRLDGRLTEAGWATADSIPNLITIEPEEGGIPAGRTVVKVLANPNEIVFGVQCFDDPAGIVSFSKARDAELDEEDHVLIVLDTFGDERSGYVFGINPTGSRFDGLVTAQGNDVNSSWDTVWEAAASTNSAGWCAEVRLPIKSLSFKKGLDRWGFNVERRIQRLQETSRWSGAKRDFEIFQTSQAGVLSGLPDFDLGWGLTVRPGVVADAKRPAPGTSRDFGTDFSLDVNQKLGSNLSATATVNTDFGETEADVRRTNLSRFDLLFPEKRAFFLEGADIFEFGLGLDLESASVLPFFSRRIGLYTPEGEDEGTEVPLQAGGKLQGRIGETNLGALFVATDEVDEFGVPRSKMGVVRVRQNVLSESSLGMIATFGDPLDRQSWLGGVDATYRTSEFREDKNLLAGLWGLTTHREDLGDDRHAFGGKIAYPNDLFDLGLTYFRVGKDFAPSLGFVQRTGQVLDAQGDYQPRPENALIRQLSFGLSYFRALNVDGEWESYSAAVKPLDVVFESGERLRATIEPQGEQPLENFDVFASPEQTVEIATGTYHWTRYTLLGTLAPKRRVSGEVSWSFGGFYEGDLRTIEAAVVLKPAPVLSVELTGERNMATLPEGDFTQFLYGVRTELKFSPEFHVTNFVQYDNESRSLGSATRLRWTYHPLGDLFVAFNHNMTRSIDENEPRWQFDSDQILVKIQHALRF